MVGAEGFPLLGWLGRPLPCVGEELDPFLPGDAWGEPFSGLGVVTLA